MKINLPRLLSMINALVSIFYLSLIFAIHETSLVPTVTVVDVALIMPHTRYVLPPTSRYLQEPCKVPPLIDGVGV